MARESEKVIQEVETKHVLLARPYSMHPDDWYLSIVMAALPDNNLHPYATWLHNATGNSPDYFCQGHYFKEKEEAFEDWKTRR